MLNYLLQALRLLYRVTDRIAMTANTIGTLVVMVLVLVVDYDVLSRGLFNKPFMGAVEVVQFSMVLIVFMQLPDVIRVNRLTRSEGFLLLAQPRFPRLALWIRQFIDAVSALLMVLIAIAIWPEFIEMFETKDYFGIPGIFVAPWWPIKLTICVSALLCALVLSLKVIFAGQPVESSPAVPGTQPGEQL